MKRTRVLGCLLTLVVLLILGLALAIAFNPFLGFFLTSFQVTNASGSDLEIMPIGMWNGSDDYGPLPRYRSARPPYIPCLRRPISLRAGETARIVYDWDDINFRHVLVKDTAGRLRILDTDKRGTRGYSYAPQRDRYIIPRLNDLSSAPQELLPCFAGESVTYSAAKQYPENDP